MGSYRKNKRYDKIQKILSYVSLGILLMLLGTSLMLNDLVIEQSYVFGGLIAVIGVLSLVIGLREAMARRRTASEPKASI
ncbi:hypothetical protein [Devriesea agamarum]|uniref:hypothetical protein n=1 Tax=Devriesea agamarum TaxID=472569 RepID=UPI00071C4480|nr:hypothetical protein [Devriesea agamarum]